MQSLATMMRDLCILFEASIVLFERIVCSEWKPMVCKIAIWQGDLVSKAQISALSALHRGKVNLSRHLVTPSVGQLTASPLELFTHGFEPTAFLRQVLQS